MIATRVRELGREDVCLHHRESGALSCKERDARRRISANLRRSVGLSLPRSGALVFGQSVRRRRRSALPITLTELRLIAALAIIGLSRRPKNGYSTPAAIGMPSTL